MFGPILCLICLLIKNSHQSFRVTADPLKVEIGVSPKLDILCNYPPATNSTIISIIVSHATGNQNPHFNELMSVTGPNVTHDLASLSQDNVTLYGAVNAQNGSYAQISWKNPSEKVLGLYKCDILGIDLLGHLFESYAFVLVSVETPNMDIFADSVRELLESVDKMQKFYHYMGDMLNDAAVSLR